MWKKWKMQAKFTIWIYNSVGKRIGNHNLNIHMLQVHSTSINCPSECVAVVAFVRHELNFDQSGSLACYINNIPAHKKTLKLPSVPSCWNIPHTHIGVSAVYCNRMHLKSDTETQTYIHSQQQSTLSALKLRLSVFMRICVPSESIVTPYLRFSFAVSNETKRNDSTLSNLRKRA